MEKPVLAITALYAGISALIILGLAILVVTQRLRSGVGVGVGDDDRLLRTVRMHGNAVEYIPLCLLLIAMLEANGAPGWYLHLLGLALVVGRLAHAQGLWSRPDRSPGRAIGMLTTWGVQAVAGVTCIAIFLELL